MVLESECHVDDSVLPVKEIAHPSVQWSNASCAISTVYGIPSVDEFLRRVIGRRCKSDRAVREAFVLFSDLYNTVGPSPGQKVAEFIKNNPELGSIVETPARVNPNTDNWVIAWLWAPDYKSDLARTYR